MDEPVEVCETLIDAGHIEVTTVQVVQNVDADRILATLKWLVDRVNKLSDSPLKNEIVGLRDSLQKNSSVLAEQGERQVSVCIFALSVPWPLVGY
jgi:hypothetical protein